MKVSVLAEEKAPESVGLSVTLHDWQGRKILLKDGGVWEVSQDILLSVPVEEICEEEGQITVIYRNRRSGETKKYVFGVVKSK